MHMGAVMKALLLAGAFLGVVGFAWFKSGDANVYPLSQAEAYAKLTAAHPPSDGKSAFGTQHLSASGNGESKVYWNASGTFSSTHCEAEITPEGASKSRIMAFCQGGGASDGAAAGMVSGMQRRAMIEHIDATLKGRPFDPLKAQGDTASRWPSDARQPDGSYGTMVAGALKMDRDIHNMERGFAKQAKEAQAAEAAHAGVQFRPGQPMVDVSGSRSR